MAGNFVTGLWVVAVEVATVGVGSMGGIRFTGNVGLIGIVWLITLTLNLLFAGTLALLCFSAFLGCQVCLPVPKNVLILLIRDG